MYVKYKVKLNNLYILLIKTINIIYRIKYKTYKPASNLPQISF